MKRNRVKSNSSKQNLFFKPGEIEKFCLDELQAAGYLPSSPSPIRIERFVEKRFLTPSYEELPSNILGLTRFGPKGVAEIVISRSLIEDESQVAKRRVNSTLAHEAGHALLHTSIFSFTDPGPSLLQDGLDCEAQKILCRDEGIASGSMHMSGTREAGWWEVHANRAIGGFLLPKPLVEQALDSVLSTRGLLGTRFLEAERRQEAERILSDIFDVNPRVARIRLQGLYPESGEEQMSL